MIKDIASVIASIIEIYLKFGTHIRVEGKVHIINNCACFTIKNKSFSKIQIKRVEILNEIPLLADFCSSNYSNCRKLSYNDELDVIVGEESGELVAFPTICKIRIEYTIGLCKKSKYLLIQKMIEK